MVTTPVCKCLKYRVFYATVGFRTAAAANPTSPSGGKKRPMPKVTMSPTALSRMVESSQIHVCSPWVRRCVHSALTQDTPPPIFGQSAGTRRPRSTLYMLTPFNFSSKKLYRNQRFVCQQTGGYCWPTPKYRNWYAQHAIFEGKKAEQTPREKVLLELEGGWPTGIGRVFERRPLPLLHIGVAEHHGAT